MVNILLCSAVLLAPINLNPEITIYNGGFGLIKEVRTVTLQKGRQLVNLDGVAETIEPTSVGFRDLTAPTTTFLLEQNYQYDLISPIAILNKSVGQRIKIVRFNGDKKDVIEGTLISAPTAIVAGQNGQSQFTYNGMVIRTDDGRIVLDPRGEVEVTELPGNLISKPTLIWDLETSTAGDHQLEVSYLAQQLDWEAAYVMTLNSGTSGDLQGWVTLTNNSGATWIDAKLKLLAGEVNRVQPQRAQADFMVKESLATMRGRGANFEEESLFEYHLYTLQRPATVKNREMKQVSFLEGKNIPIRKKIILDATAAMGRYFPGEGEVGTGTISPQVRIEFENSEKFNLGMPLPGGTVKVYQRDKSGSVQLLGEDAIQHTPRNEKLSLIMGRSFDIKGERKRLSFKKLSSNRYEETFEVEIRNRKKESETVFVVERAWGDWKITSKNTNFTKLGSNAFQFEVLLKPDEVRKVVYTIETQW